MSNSKTMMRHYGTWRLGRGSCKEMYKFATMRLRDAMSASAFCFGQHAIHPDTIQERRSSFPRGAVFALQIQANP